MAQTSIEDPKTAEAAPEETEAATLSTGATMSIVIPVTPSNPIMDHTNWTGGEAGAAPIWRARTAVDTKDIIPKTSPPGALSEAKSYIRKLIQKLKLNIPLNVQNMKFFSKNGVPTTVYGLLNIYHFLLTLLCLYSLLFKCIPPPPTSPANKKSTSLNVLSPPLHPLEKKVINS